MSEPSPPAARDVPAKSTLFCPDCGHRSRVDGDWNRAELARETRYRCPDCGHVVTTRPTFDSDGPLEPELWRSAWRAWGASVRTWGTFWRGTLALR